MTQPGSSFRACGRLVLCITVLAGVQLLRLPGIRATSTECQGFLEDGPFPIGTFGFLEGFGGPALCACPPDSSGYYGNTFRQYIGGASSSTEDPFSGSRKPEGDGSVTACCTVCEDTLGCQGFTYESAKSRCYLLTGTQCDLVDAIVGGAGFSGRLCASAQAQGAHDPHFVLPLPEGAQNAEDFTFDFHGADNGTYCMVSERNISLNVRMFKLPASTQVLYRPEAELEPFFEGTWMNGLGFVYYDNLNNKVSQSLTVELEHNATINKKPSYKFAFNGDSINNHFDVSSQVLKTWTSPDNVASISWATNQVDMATVILKDLLEIEVVIDSEEEVITDPPLYFLNFKIVRMVTSPDTHGFLGQMFVEGAKEARLAMGTLEGLLHREFVEGTDEEYATTGLTATDCGFNRFEHEDSIQ